MAKKRNTDFASFLRSQGLRKRLAKAVSDLEGSDIRGNADKLARRVIGDLRSAADEIEKRLNVSAAAAKRRAPARRRARKSTARKTTARKTTARKSTARKTTARKSTARKTTARKTTAKKAPAKRASTARKTTARKTTRRAPRKSS